jgi:oligopeptide transport system substrate-binding protein
MIVRIFFLIFHFGFWLPQTCFAESILYRGNGSEPNTLDPHKANGTWENNIIGDLFIGLTSEFPDGTIGPGAATSWSVGEKGLIYRFTMRSGLRWSDGTVLTAEDFVFAFQRILTPETASSYASLLFVIENAQNFYSGKVGIEQLGVRNLGENVLEITLEEPVPFFEQLLSHPTTFPVPRHVVEAYGDEWIKPENFVSNGAFVLMEWIPHGHVRVKKNKYFYDSKNVSLSEIYYLPINDSRTALKMFRAGKIHMNVGVNAFPARQMSSLMDSLPGEARIYPSLGNSYLPMNTVKAPFDDFSVRKAISMLINREIINDRVMAVGNSSAYSFVPPQIRNYVLGARLDYISLDMNNRRSEAIGMLKKAGYDHTNPLVFSLTIRNSYENMRRANAISAMLKSAGVTVNILAHEARVVYGLMRTGDYQLGDAGWVADYDDPQNFLYLLTCDAGPMNYSRYCNTEYDSLLSQASKTRHLNDRAHLLAKAEQLMLDGHPIIPMAFIKHRNLISKNVSGFKDNINNIHRSRYISIHTE